MNINSIANHVGLLVILSFLTAGVITGIVWLVVVALRSFPDWVVFLTVALTLVLMPVWHKISVWKVVREQ